ncbi:MAG: lysophospholipid acyltransferase family protein [Planctomycetes bacterium]|nr:lysophospholipid acyltransferase family protein [Planctomycetota bacterium]
MKIRSPLVIKWISLLGAWLIKVYMGTICVRVRSLVGEFDPRHKNLEGRFIYAFFHEGILLPCSLFARRNIHVLISQHADGELIARVCGHLGFSTIRGSTTRGGARALRQMIDVGRTGHIAVIPDGPRGPRRHVEQGLIYLAARTGMAIVPVGIGYRKPWRLPTWDKFAIPRPFSESWALAAEPIAIPTDLEKKQLEAFRLSVEAALNRINEIAERVANR